MKADAAPETILFNFQSATSFPVWQIVNDDAMGGMSAGQFQRFTQQGVAGSGVQW
jgi:hypothetical protein